MNARYAVFLLFVSFAHAQVRPTGTHKDEKPVEKTRMELPRQDDERTKDPFFQQQAATKIIAENRNNCGDMIKAENPPIKNIEEVNILFQTIQAKHIFLSLPEINKQKYTYLCEEAQVFVSPLIKCLLHGSEEVVDQFVKNKKSLGYLQDTHKMKNEDAKQLLNVLEFFNTPLLKEKRLEQKK